MAMDEAKEKLGQVNGFHLMAFKAQPVIMFLMTVVMAFFWHTINTMNATIIDLNQELKAVRQINATLSERLVTIESSRFRTEDGLDIWKELATIKKDIAVLQSESKSK